MILAEGIVIGFVSGSLTVLGVAAIGYHQVKEHPQVIMRYLARRTVRSIREATKNETPIEP